MIISILHNQSWREKSMPLYEYKCKSCGKLFEVLQKINSEPLKKCLYCNGRVEKQISVSSFQFKGTGWYITDYKKNNSQINKQNQKKENKVTKPEKNKVDKDKVKDKNVNVK